MLRTKSIIYKSHGPLTNLQIHKHSIETVHPKIPIKILFAPLNPSDINMISGTYPIKPILNTFGYIPGQEGVGVVLESRGQVREGNYVLPLNQSFNTFQTHASPEKVLDLGRLHHLSPKFVGSISVNPASALVMLRESKVLRGDWIIQNAGTSHLSRSLIQLAKVLGIKTVTVIREGKSEEESEVRRQSLKALGGDLVLLESEVEGRSRELKDLKIKVAFNGVGGESCLRMAKILNENGLIITYGGMSRRPVTMPTSLFIFKNITCRGFWLNKYLLQRDIQFRMGIYKELLEFGRDGLLSEPVEIPLGRVDSSEEEDRLLLSRLTSDSPSKKFLVASID